MIAINEDRSSPARRGQRRSWEDRWPQAMSMAQHYRHVFLAIIMFFLAQLLTCAWDQPFWAHKIDFPGQIVAMVFVWLSMWTVQRVFFKPGEGLERFYHRYLRAPTEILNKHMSIGFTVPFLRLISQSFAGADQVGLLTVAFMVTGILNAIFVYAVAYHMQLGLSRFAARVWSSRKTGNMDVEAAQPRHDATAQSDAGTTGLVLPSGVVDDAGCGGGDRVSDQSCLDRFRKHISDVSTLCTLSGHASDVKGPNLAYVEEGRAGGGGGQPADALRVLDGSGPCTTKQSSSLLLHRILGTAWAWIRHNIFLTSSILLFLLVGLPLSCLWHNDLFLDIGYLSTVWLTFTSAQTRVKLHIKHSRRPQDHRHHHHHHHHTTRKPFLTALATLLNPVLWTSLFLLCYGLAKSHIRGEFNTDVVARFQTTNTVSDLIAHHIDTSYLTHSPTAGPALPLGAGDLATSVLNAGIVSWGLKLFEYRAQLVSRGGLTVLLTSALAALANVVAGPLLAHALGVRPAAFDLSFAARSVTIALGGPAMTKLGGDAGVNAVGVVVNGICFQLVAGCFVGGEEGFEGVVRRWREVILRWLWMQKERTGVIDPPPETGTPDQDKSRGRNSPSVIAEPDHNATTGHDNTPRYSSDATHVDDRRPARITPETTAPGRGIPTQQMTDGAQPSSAVAVAVNDGPAVAAGVAIGINAAAMGTAHLYEQESHAAPYSALSMTVFGVFTVLFTMGSPMVEWLNMMVAS